MLAVAGALAVVEQADAIATAVHAGDHPIYPDCRPAFIDAMTAVLQIATEGHGRPGLHVLAPFLLGTKADIVRRAADLGVPLGATWSCYQGARLHCGDCGTCVERREAFAVAGVADPTEYVIAAA
jgi:7-cyano-7-deazaguanine synthase